MADEQKKDETKKEIQEDSMKQADVNSLTVISSRLKILEERYSILRKKTQTTDNNIIDMEKNQFSEFKLLNDDIVDVKKKLKNLTEKIELLAEEIGNFADRREFSIVKKYVDHWQPMDFVTRKEVNNFLRKKFEK